METIKEKELENVNVGLDVDPKDDINVGDYFLENYTNHIIIAAKPYSAPIESNQLIEYYERDKYADTMAADTSKTYYIPFFNLKLAYFKCGHINIK